jgi:shikimate kinase
MDNLILIGMPGSGKSSIGLLLAQRLGCDFIDTDELIEQQQNRSISELFAEEGELYFRDLETKAAREVSQFHQTVIATGGGMILRPENMEALKPSGLIVFVDRPPEEIVSGNLSARPLIGENRDRVFSLYRARIELYRRYAQYIVENRSTPEACAEEILACWKEGHQT